MSPKLGFALFIAIALISAWHFRQPAKIDRYAYIAGQKLDAIDGDSFYMGTNAFRLRGIDAPEYRQSCKDENGQSWPCGEEAKASLQKLLSQGRLQCESEARDRFGRILATCGTAHTTDIAAAMVRGGFAVSNNFYGMRDYPEEEDSAKAEKKGIWQGPFQQPSEWRDANPR